MRRVTEIVGKLRAQLARRRWMRAVPLAVLVLCLVYLVAANLFLAFGGVQKAFEGTETVKVDFRHAWSFWPGRVHASDIRVIMQDRNVQFALEIPSVDVTVRLRDLVHRTFHATRVRGSGVVFHFRHRISRESADLPFVRELPSIPGFEDPPLFEEGAPPPSTNEAQDRLWTVHIEDVDVEVRDLWIQMFRYQGAARALGAFRLRPTQRVWVGPAELRLERGQIDKGSREMAAVTGGVVSCKVDDFDVQSVHGLDVVRFISAEASLKTENLRLGELGPCPWMEARTANLQGHVRGQPSGSVDIGVGAELDGTSLRWGKFRATAAHASFTTAWTGERLSTDVDASGLRFRSAGGPPKGWKAEVRSAMIRTNLQLAEEGLRGPARMEARNITGQVGKTTFEGNLIASLDLGLKEPSYRVADVSGVVQVRKVAVHTGTHEVNDWWAKLELRKAHLDTRRNFDLKGGVETQFKDALPALYVLAAEQQIPKWAPAVLPMRSLELDLRVERFCHWTDVQLTEPAEGRFKVSGRVQVEPGTTQGALLFRISGFPPVSLGLKFDEGETATSLLAGQGWLDTHLAPLAKAAANKHAVHCAPEPPSCD